MSATFAKQCLLAASVISLSTLAACSTQGSGGSNVGKAISARGQAVSDRGAAWSDGQRDVQRGQKLVQHSDKQQRDGEKQLKRAQDNLAKAERQIQVAQADRTQGEQLVSNGAAQMQPAEAQYTAIHNGPTAITPQ